METALREGPSRPPAGGAPAPIETDPAIVEELIRRCQDSIAVLQRDIRAKSGPALVEFILAGVRDGDRGRLVAQ